MFSRTKVTTRAFSARAIPLLLAIGFAVFSLACSSGPLPFMGSCLHMMDGKTSTCYEFYGEQYRGSAESQCKYFNKPEFGTTTKVLSSTCPDEGKKSVFVQDFPDEGVRMETWRY
jgi:hypothetical protein